MKKKYKITNRITAIVLMVLFMEIGMLVLFFMEYRQVVKDETIKSYQNLSGQLVEQFAGEKENLENIAFQVSYSNGIQEYLLSQDTVERYRNISTLQENLEYVLSANADVLNIRVLGKNGRLINSNRGTVLPTVPSYYIDKAAEEMMRTEAVDGSFTDFLYSKADECVYYSYLLPMYSSYQKRGNSEMIGVCAVTSSLSALQKSIRAVTGKNDVEYLILDDSYQILAAENEEKIGDIYSEGEKWEFVEDDAIIFQQDSHFFRITVDSKEGLILSYAIPDATLTADIPSVLIILFGVILAATVAIFIVTIRLLHNITHPISVMVEEMRGITMQTENNRLSTVANNEIGAVAVEINHMLERIERLNYEKIEATKELNKTKLLQKQAELSFLRSQINPHFLYNSLECIRGMALAFGAEEIESITISLSKLYRYALSSNETVLLKDELKCVMEYCNIMSIRFRKNYYLKVLVSKEMMEEEVLAMILQPIIENSFKHGFVSGKGSMIQILGREEGEYLYLDISDDGKGMSPELIEKLSDSLKNGNAEENAETEKSSIGLKNIQKRIQMHDGKECGLRIGQNGEQGLTVSVILRKNKI